MRGWGSSSSGNGKVLLECKPGSSQLGNPVPKRCGQVFIEVERVDLFHNWAVLFVSEGEFAPIIDL